jgi:hypothetical protein
MVASACKGTCGLAVGLLNGDIVGRIVTFAVGRIDNFTEGFAVGILEGDKVTALTRLGIKSYATNR